MIDYQEAKRRVMQGRLPAYEEDLETKAVLLEQLTEEHDWGWLFYWEPEEPSKVPPEIAFWGWERIAVDRTNGRVYGVGTGGLKGTVFLMRRDRELLDGDGE